MKKIQFYLKTLLVIFLLLTVKITVAQCTAGFNYTVNANGYVSFLSTSTSLSLSATTYTWDYGDSSPVNTAWSQTAVNHSYPNGTYTVNLTLTTYSPSYCTDTFSQTVTVANSSCNINLIPSFSYTNNGTGNYNFQSTSINTTANTIYNWDFGDSSVGTTSSVAHTYSVSNNNLITLILTDGFCTDTISTYIQINTSPPCSLTTSFSYSQATNGVVNFYSTSTGTTSSMNYYWNFGDNNSASGTNIAVTTNTYIQNGIFPVYLSIYSNPSCSVSISQTINVTSAPATTCNLNASFTYTQGSNGFVNFESTSTGTNTQTSYVWDFGLGTNPNVSTNYNGNGPTAAKQYFNNQSYIVSLTATNNFTSTCVSTQTLFLTISNTTCNIIPNFSFTQGANGLVTFTNTSVGTSTTDSYYWNFGDLNYAGGINMTLTPQTYSVSGTYTAELTILASVAMCTAYIQSPITVNLPCSITAGFTSTVGTQGDVVFTDNSIGTNTATTFYWNYGDGFTGIGSAPSHTYSSAGNYNVLLVATNSPSCLDSIYQQVNVTGIPCIANSGFSMTPTATAQVWNATPSVPWNVVAATWNWGDATTTNGLYTSHSYSASGTYSICLTVTVSCGATSSTCASSFIFKSSNLESSLMIQVDVIAPSTIPLGLTNNVIAEMNYIIYPNPNSGQFELKLNGSGSELAKIKVYNMVGELVYEMETKNDDLIKKIDLAKVSNGVYFMKINSSNKEVTKKIIIAK